MSTGEWMSYAFEIDDQPAFCMFNMEHAESLDQPKPQSAAFLLRIPFTTQGTAGVGEQEEVDEIRDTFEAVLKKGDFAKVLHIASVRSVGQLDEWAYCEPGMIATLESACKAAFADRNVEVMANQDPDWEMYQSLIPDDDQMAAHQDMMLIRQIAQAGDQLEQEREVIHVVLVPIEAVAETVAAFKAAGFAPTPLQSEEDSELVTIEVVATHNLMPENVVETRQTITSIAEQHGGGYDGWESPVIT
jgi:hypothetical protein